MNASIAKAMLHSHTYTEYRTIVSNLIAEGKSSGNEQTEDLLHYSVLNETRMNRLDKTMKVSDENSLHLKNLQKNYLWIVLAEGWCGDAAQLLPIFNKMANESEAIEMKIAFRDENIAVMNLFLTNQAQAIPKLIIIDKETGNVINHWGPRPKGASDFIKEYKAKFGVVDANAKAELQLWYLHDKGLSTQNEIMEMLVDFEELKNLTTSSF
jgi:hypothetical protein